MLTPFDDATAWIAVRVTHMKCWPPKILITVEKLFHIYGEISPAQYWLSEQLDGLLIKFVK